MKLETLHPSLPTTRSSRRWRAPLAIVIVLAAGGAGWTALHGKPPAPANVAKDGKDGGKAAAPVMELAGSDIAAIDARALAVKLPLSGSLAPLSSATIKSKVSGVVELTTVQEGMSVAAGQVLARIDQADLRARLQQQQAALDEAQARLALASKNENNSQTLLKQRFISQTAYDATQNSVDLARANVKSAAAMVEIARIALNDGVIRAPISGVISKRHVQAGEKLAPDMPVFSIVNLSELTLEAQVPATEIPRVKIGQAVSFKVDGFQGRDFSGKVTRINPATEAGSRAMLVYIAVQNQDSALRAGMFAKGSIVTDHAELAPIIPLTALRGTSSAPLVYKIEAGKVIAQAVKLGLRNEDEGLVAVLDGLQAGAQVIVAKLDAVKPGTQVKLPAAATPAEEAARQASAAAAAAAKKG